MKAKDVMEKIDKVLSPEDSLLDAIEKMAITKRSCDVVGVKGMLVLDSEGRFVGILSLKNIFRAVIPSYLFLEESLSGLAWEGMLEEKLLPGLENRKVKEVMDAVKGMGYESEQIEFKLERPENDGVVTVGRDASLMECAIHMLYHDINRLPVIDGSKVVGIIYSRDMLTALLELIRKKLAERGGEK